ncbi:oxygenase [Lithospermum erythrorhizon]|uniref:Oxygenase n=1 Tax=Lithospermum erythrorhizon TaxID=34254 RepID=A0AAV3QB20_LITER
MCFFTEYFPSSLHSPNQNIGVLFIILSILPTIILVSYVLILVLFKWQHNVNNMSRNPLPPGPKSWPIVGSLIQTYTNRPISQWIHKTMEEMNTEILCIRLGNVHVISVTSPEISCEILKKQDTLFSSRPLCNSTFLPSSGFRTAIFAPLGDQWKKMRRIISSEIVSPKKLEWLHASRVEEADHMVTYILNKFKNLTSSTSCIVNVRMVTRHYCANIMRKMHFNKRFFGSGLQDGGPGEEEMEHVDAIFTLLDHVYAFDIADYLPCLGFLDIFGHNKIIKKAVDSIRKYQDKIIDERILMWELGSRIEEEDILDVLILLKDKEGRSALTPEEIKAQCLELMLAGVDNPSNAFEWALAEMLNQPNILTKATKELDKIVGRQRLVQESDIPHLNYIMACAKEAFRLHPISYFIPPHVPTDDVIIDGYFIPKGSHVLISRYGLGRNPRVWTDPLRFDPDRHLMDDGSCVNLIDSEMHMLSFGMGRRGCPGMKLGSTMTCMLFARLLQTFDWRLPENMISIDLRSESKIGTSLAKPLLAQASPRMTN